MIEPSLDKLMKKTDSRYTLVITAAKRARMLGQIHKDDEGYFDTDKAVSMATREIGEGKVTYTREDYVAPPVYEMPNFAINYALHDDKDDDDFDDDMSMEDALLEKDALAQED